METVDLSNYVAGGYFVAKPVPREEWMSAELLPEQLITLSSCRNPSKVEIYWGWDTDKHREKISELGIPENKLDAFRAWSTSDNFAYPNVMYTLEAAQEFVTQFLPHSDEYQVFGVGLPKALVSILLDFEGQAVEGTNRLLAEHSSLALNGVSLGFDIISYAHGDLNCSWLCNGIDRDMYQEFGIRPNQYGLIDRYNDAKQVYDWIAEDELRGTRAEPLPYYPWLIVQYPIT